MKIPKRLRRPILIIFHALRRAIGVMGHCVRRNRRGEYYVTESVVVWPTVLETPTDFPQTASEIPADGLIDSSETTSEIPADGLTETPDDDLTDET